MAEKQEIPHILELSVEEQKNFIESFDVVFSDCDGVVWLIAENLPNTGTAINVLKEYGKRVVFVTNNSLRTDDEYYDKFTSIGVKNFDKNDIMHPAKAMISYLKRNKIEQPVFSLCSTEANKTLQNGGIQIQTMEVKSNLTVPKLAEAIRAKERVGAVLFDINLNLTYAQLARAGQYLKQPDCALISGGTDVLLPVCADLIAPGFADFLEHLSKAQRKEPMILGKPSTALGDILCEVYGITDAKRCLFVGDSLTHDMKFGNACGFQTLFVLTGTSTKEDMLKASNDLKPTYYANGLVDFIQIIENVKELK